MIQFLPTCLFILASYVRRNLKISSSLHYTYTIMWTVKSNLGRQSKDQICIDDYQIYRIAFMPLTNDNNKKFYLQQAIQVCQYLYWPENWPVFGKSPKFRSIAKHGILISNKINPVKYQLVIWNWITLIWNWFTRYVTFVPN